MDLFLKTRVSTGIIVSKAMRTAAATQRIIYEIYWPAVLTREHDMKKKQYKGETLKRATLIDGRFVILRWLHRFLH